jgi:hypothetical protein
MDSSAARTSGSTAPPLPCSWADAVATRLQSGDAATGLKQRPNRAQARDLVFPEAHRVDGQNLVEDSVEAREASGRPGPQVDPTGSDGFGVSSPCLSQHDLGVVDTAHHTSANVSDFVRSL